MGSVAKGGHIPMPPSSSSPKEEKVYVYDEEDFEEEAEPTKLFHLAAESHSSGMRSSKREVLYAHKQSAVAFASNQAPDALNWRK